MKKVKEPAHNVSLRKREIRLQRTLACNMVVLRMMTRK
jgi:hypothetical protein